MMSLFNEEYIQKAYGKEKYDEGMAFKGRGLRVSRNNRINGVSRPSPFPP